MQIVYAICLFSCLAGSFILILQVLYDNFFEIAKDE